MSYYLAVNGSSNQPIVSYAETLAAAKKMGWDTSWWEHDANTITLRSGKHPSSATLLLQRSALSGLTKNTYHDIVLPNYAVPQFDGDGAPVANGTPITLYNWVFVSAKAVDGSWAIANDGGTIDGYTNDPVPENTPSEDQVLVVRFEDQRRLFAQSYCSANYNRLKSASHNALQAASAPSDNADYDTLEYFDDTLNSSNPYTWTEVLEDLRDDYLAGPAATAIQTSGFSGFEHTPSGSGGVYDIEPINLSCGECCEYETAWDLFCAILVATGHTLSHIPTQDSSNYFVVVPINSTSSTTQTAVHAKLNLNPTNPDSIKQHRLVDTRNPEGCHDFLPATIKIAFPSGQYNNADEVGVVPQDSVFIDDTYTVDKAVSSISSNSPSTVADTFYTVNADGFYKYTTEYDEESSPSPDILRNEQLETVAEELATRYVEALEIPDTNWTFFGCFTPVADQKFPLVEIKFGPQDWTSRANDLVHTTFHSFPPVPRLTAVEHNEADITFPHEKWVYVYVTESGGIDVGKAGSAYFQRADVGVDTAPDPDELEWTLSGTDTGSVVNLTSASLSNGATFSARFDYRLGKWVVPPAVASAATADELRGEVSSYTAAGASGNTYGIITLKTSSPAPIPLPTGAPALVGTIYVADVYGLGASYFTSGKLIRAIRNVAVDTLSAADVDWEHNDPTGDGLTPFVCMVTASLTASAWSNTNKRLTPAANTNTCVLLGWDSGNSWYDEATDGTVFSPDWIGPAITINSGKALKGWGVYHDGRYKLRTVDCIDNEVDYT